MTTDEVISFYGGSRRHVAQLLDVSTQSVGMWGKEPPAWVQFKLHILTDGRLKADMSARGGRYPDTKAEHGQEAA